ncbi:MAG: hypothetical protein VYE43_01365, partial [Pseudomonadota bacterium]|nr:hypothetical protein [Pseudomonadota bacterium]
IEAYQSGDPYIHTAKLFGFLEPGAVRNEQTEGIRNMFKVIDLANTYGQGYQNIETDIGRSGYFKNWSKYKI